jgi:hypothetical protein
MPGKSKRLATAPVAMITELAAMVLELVNILKGVVVEKSTLLTVSVRIWVPKRRDWLRH